MNKLDNYKPSSIEQKLKYGYCNTNIVGRHLVDQGVADTRAIEISKALSHLYRAIADMDGWQLPNLIKKERHLVEMVNWYANLECDFMGRKCTRTFDEDLAKI